MLLLSTDIKVEDKMMTPHQCILYRYLMLLEYFVLYNIAFNPGKWLLN